MNFTEYTDQIYKKQLQQRLRYFTKHVLEQEMQCWWFVSFHYNDNHTNKFHSGLPVGENELISDVSYLKRQLHRSIYKGRDRILKGAGGYPYPRMLFFHETSHQGTGQYHTHLIVEKMPTSLNTQYAMETLFYKRLPRKVMALSRWKSVDIQRINPEDDDYRHISDYLSKQTNLELIALDPFNSDLSIRKK